jgi:hypothetical protein
MTHRSPTKAVPSYASMVKALTSQYSDSVDPLLLGPYWSRRFVDALGRFARVRAARPDRFVDVRFEDTVSDPVGVAVRVLGELDTPASDEDTSAFEAFVTRDREEHNAKHAYKPEDFGLTQAQLEADFAFYTEEYL